MRILPCHAISKSNSISHVVLFWLLLVSRRLLLRVFVVARIVVAVALNSGAEVLKDPNPALPFSVPQPTAKSS